MHVTHIMMCTLILLICICKCKDDVVKKWGDKIHLDNNFETEMTL